MPFDVIFHLDYFRKTILLIMQFDMQITYLVIRHIDLILLFLSMLFMRTKLTTQAFTCSTYLNWFWNLVFTLWFYSLHTLIEIKILKRFYINLEIDTIKQVMTISIFSLNILKDKKDVLHPKQLYYLKVVHIELAICSYQQKINSSVWKDDINTKWQYWIWIEKILISKHCRQ